MPIRPVVFCPDCGAFVGLEANCPRCRRRGLSRSYRCPLPGVVLARPTQVQDMIVVPVRRQRRCQLVAVDMRSGAKRWIQPLPATARVPSVGYRERVFQAVGSQLCSFDMATGTGPTLRLPGRIAGSMPAVENGTLYLACERDVANAFVCAVDLESFKLVQSVPLPQVRIAADLAVENSTVFAGSCALKKPGICAVDMQAGQLRWYKPTSGLIYTVCVTDENIVYAGCDEGVLYAFRTSDGQSAHRPRKLPGHALAELLAHGRNLYAVANVVRSRTIQSTTLWAILMEDWREIWRFEELPPLKGTLTPCAGLLYGTLQDAKSQVWLLVVDGSSRYELARVPLGYGPVAFAPLLVGSAVWVGVGTLLVCNPIHLGIPSLASSLADGFEREGDVSLAADYWALASEFDEATRLYEKAGEKLKAEEIATQHGGRAAATSVSETPIPATPGSRKSKVLTEQEPAEKRPQMNVQLQCEPRDLTIGEQGKIVCHLTNDRAESLEVHKVIAKAVTDDSEQIKLVPDADEPLPGETTISLFATFSRAGEFQISVLALYRGPGGQNSSARGKAQVKVIDPSREPRHIKIDVEEDTGTLKISPRAGTDVEIKTRQAGLIKVTDREDPAPEDYNRSKDTDEQAHANGAWGVCPVCNVEITDISRSTCTNCGNPLH